MELQIFYTLTWLSDAVLSSLSRMLLGLVVKLVGLRLVLVVGRALVSTLSSSGDSCARASWFQLLLKSILACSRLTEAASFEQIHVVELVPVLAQVLVGLLFDEVRRWHAHVLVAAPCEVLSPSNVSATFHERRRRALAILLHQESTHGPATVLILSFQ